MGDEDEISNKKLLELLLDLQKNLAQNTPLIARSLLMRSLRSANPNKKTMKIGQKLQNQK